MKQSGQAVGNEKQGLSENPSARGGAANERGGVETQGQTHRSVSTNMSTEERSRVHTEITRVHIREAPNLTVDVHVGATAPRTVTETARASMAKSRSHQFVSHLGGPQFNQV